jgi:hypothetical protein
MVMLRGRRRGRKIPPVILFWDRNVNFLYHTDRFGAHQIDRKEAVSKLGAEHPHTVGKHESPLKLSGGDAAMEIILFTGFDLTTANDELVLFRRHFQILIGKPCDGERDPQPFRRAGGAVAANALDVVGWVSVVRLGDPLEGLFHAVEAHQQRARKRRNPAHSQVLVSSSDHLSDLPGSILGKQYGSCAQRVQAACLGRARKS